MSSSGMSIPDFSIIIPTYNRCEFLKQALVSVLRQKGVSFEVIVSDNCSTDHTEKIVKSFRDKRIKYSRNKKNLGYVLNAHKCFRKSSGKYIFTLSDDDFILDDNTLLDIFKIMKKYQVAIGKIGTILYENSPDFPYREYILSDQLVVLKPKKDKELIRKTLDFELGFFSGLIFDNNLIDKKKLINDFGYVYFPMAFEAILKHGIAYIPKHFIVANLSLRFWETYFDIDKFGSFYIEDLFAIVRKFISGKEYKEYKKEYLSRGIVLLPNYKYFTSNRNYVRILQRYIRLEKALLINIRFIVYAMSGFLPKIIIKMIRYLIIYRSKRGMYKTMQKYNYSKEIKDILS